jgi:hypothetical protein
MAKQEQIITIKVETGQAKSQIAGVNKQLDKTSKTAKKSGKGLAGAFGAMKQGILGAIPALRAFSAALVSTGVGAIVVAIGALTSMFISAARKGAEFEKALSGLEAVSGSTEAEMTALSNQAKDLGASTAFTASQVVKLQTELAKLGFTVGDIQNSTPAILDLASSLEVDLASAAEFAGSVVRSFGLTTEETQRVVDVMALSTASSALNFGALQESLKVAAPTARAVGVSIERTAALLGVLADTGLKGSIAGTGLSKTFIALNKEGISLEDAMDKVKNSSNQLNTAVELVGVVGAKSLLNLANSGDKIGELEEKFKNAGGAAKDIAETRLDNLAGDTTKLGSAWEGFLLSIEDGSGIINKISRGAIQGLTKVISNIGPFLDYLNFAFVELGTNLKLRLSSSFDIAVGSFQKLGANIKLFTNNALLQISRIPIIGRAIDKKAVEQNIKDAAKALDDAEKRIEEGRDKQEQIRTNKATRGARFRISQLEKQQALANAQEVKALEAHEEEMAEAQKTADEEAEKEREKHLDKLAKLEEKYQNKLEDQEDKTFLEKAKRKRERALEELNALKLSAEEKRKAEKAINDFYDEEERKAKIEDDNKAFEEDVKKRDKKFEELQLEKEFEQLDFEERRNIINERRALLLEDETLNEQQRQALLKEFADAEGQIEVEKRESRQATLDNAIAIAGAETGIGRALVVAKQLDLARTLILDAKESLSKAKKTVTSATLDGASSASSVAAGSAKTAAIGFPQNIPMLIGYAAQAVGIISAIRQATSKAKSVASSAGGGGGGGSVSAPRVPSGGGQAQAPAFNVVGSSGQSQIAEAIGGQSDRPIKAYVTSNDVTSAQSLDRNIVEGATI